MVKQLHWWWKRSVEKGKGNQVIVEDADGKENVVNGHTEGKIIGNVNGVERGNAKNMAKRDGKVLHIDRG
jgi:hypothetical protein